MSETVQNVISSQLLSRARPLIMSDSAEPPEHLGGFFPRGQVSIISSKPGVGKTWFTLLNIRNITNDGCKCILLNGESGADIIGQRLALLGWDIDANYGIMLTSADYPDYDMLSLNSPKGWEALMSIIAEYGCDAIFVDSLLAFVDKDESDMKTMRDVLMRLSRLAQKKNCAVVVNHHLRKNIANNADPSINDVIGSSAISRIACCMYSIVKDDNDCVVSCQKSWYKAPANYVFRLDYSSGSLLFRNKLGVVLEKDCRGIILHTLSLKQGEWLSFVQIKAASNMSTRSLRRWLPQLVNNNQILSRRGNGNELEYSSLVFEQVP